MLAYAKERNLSKITHSHDHCHAVPAIHLFVCLQGLWPMLKVKMLSEVAAVIKGSRPCEGSIIVYLMGAFSLYSPQI